MASIDFELPKFESSTTHKLDLAFCVDCTGSMGSYIAQVQQNIKLIVSSITSCSAIDFRFALVNYRDHPPQESTFVTQIYEFTKSEKEITNYVNTMQASGGGDGPESVTTGLRDILQLKYRPDAAKLCIWIADAPPHGLEPSGDGFPEGEPNKLDPVKIVRAMCAKGIVLYSVGCEPGILHYSFAKSFMMAMAFMTEGRYVALQDCQLLTKIIVGSALEEAFLVEFFNDQQQYADEKQYHSSLVQQHKIIPHLIIEDVAATNEAWEADKQRANSMLTEKALKSATSALKVHDQQVAAKKASESSTTTTSTPVAAPPVARRRPTNVTAKQVQRVFIAKDYISLEQVKKVLGRKTKMIALSKEQQDLTY